MRFSIFFFRTVFTGFNLRKFTTFVPKSKHISDTDIDSLKIFIERSKALLVLTGAGISTESGIPDYRSEKVGLYARNGRKPTDYGEFIQSPLMRRRYWARSFVAWPTFSKFEPNFNHKLLRKWGDEGLLKSIITQNVDRLHSKAGSKNVVELHGTLYSVVCMGCGQRESREQMQDVLSRLNSSWNVVNSHEIAPDGDVMLEDHFIYDFQVPSCSLCGGILKPDVVLFGENVPRATTDKAFSVFDQADSILILGSSLYVYSGFRFVLKARQEGKRLALVNIGETRADNLIDLKVDARCSEVLRRLDPAAAAHLGGS